MTTPSHCRARKPLSRQKGDGADSDEEWRGEQKHHRARRRRALDGEEQEHELQREQHPRRHAGGEAAVEPQRLRAGASPHRPPTQKRADAVAQRALRHRPEIGERQLGGDLVAAPGDAERGHREDRETVERFRHAATHIDAASGKPSAIAPARNDKRRAFRGTRLSHVRRSPARKFSCSGSRRSDRPLLARADVAVFAWPQRPARKPVGSTGV